MDLLEVDRRWGAAARKWVWSARPRYVFEDDGSERDWLEPVDDVLPEDYEDESGWWTCHPETRIDDLAVVYRNAGRNDPEPFPIVGPRDLCYIVLVTSEPFPLKDDPLARELAKFHGCRYVVVSRFEPPVPIEDLRNDPVLAEWPALRAGFVRAAMPCPMTCGRGCPTPTSTAKATTSPGAYTESDMVTTSVPSKYVGSMLVPATTM